VGLLRLASQLPPAVFCRDQMSVGEVMDTGAVFEPDSAESSSSSSSSIKLLLSRAFHKLHSADPLRPISAI
jgi:hypothetical protein